MHAYLANVLRSHDCETLIEYDERYVWDRARELFQSSLINLPSGSQGVALGWNLRTPSAFLDVAKQNIR